MSKSITHAQAVTANAVLCGMHLFQAADVAGWPSKVIEAEGGITALMHELSVLSLQLAEFAKGVEGTDGGYDYDACTIAGKALKHYVLIKNEFPSWDKAKQICADAAQAYFDQQ